MTLKNSDHAVLYDASLRQEAMAAIQVELNFNNAEEDVKAYIYHNAKIIRELYDYYDGSSVQKIHYLIRRVWAAPIDPKGHWIVTVEAYFEPGEQLEYDPPELTYWGGKANFVKSNVKTEVTE